VSPAVVAEVRRHLAAAEAGLDLAAGVTHPQSMRVAEVAVDVARERRLIAELIAARPELVESPTPVRRPPTIRIPRALAEEALRWMDGADAVIDADDADRHAADRFDTAARIVRQLADEVV